MTFNQYAFFSVGIMYLGFGILLSVLIFFNPTDQVAIRGEGIEPKSRVFFVESTFRVGNNLLELDVPSVNFRGLMDPVS